MDSPEEGTGRRLLGLRWRFAPIYAVAIAVMFVLDAYSTASEPTTTLVRPIIVAVGLTLVIQAAATVLARSAVYGAFIAAVVVAFVCDAQLLVAALLGAVAIPGFIAILRRRPLPPIRWARLTRVFDTLSVLVFVVAFGMLLLGGQLNRPPSIAGAPGTAPPGAVDIFVIVLDGHPRADVLATKLGADPEPFAAAARARGFDVATASRSNYPLTALSLASTFGMRHLVDIPEVRAAQEGSMSYQAQVHLVSDLITRGRGLEALRAKGYEIVTIPSKSTATSVIGADRDLDSGQLNEFENVLLTRTAWRHVAPDSLRSVLATERRGRMTDAFDRIVTLAGERSDRPRFVFAHIGLPHPPPAFGPGGVLRDGWPCFPRTCSMDTIGWEQDRADLVEALRDNVAEVDRRVIETIDGVVAASEQPPVIIVMSDHGSRYDPNDHAEMFENLFMALTPGHEGLFPDDITLVNVMPRLLNAYLEADIPLSADDRYWVDIATLPARGMFALEKFDGDDAAP